MVNALIKTITTFALNFAIKQFVKYADKDKNGSVDAKELRSFIKEIEDRIKTLLKKRKL